MSLVFTDGSTNVVNCQSGTSLDDITAGTALAWVYPTTLTNDHVIMTKIGATYQGTNYLTISGGAANLRMSVDRATTDLIVSSSNSFLTTGKWWFVGSQWDLNGANGDQLLYYGDLSTPAVAISSYVLQQVGSGARVSDAANSLGIGNKVAAEAFTCWAGRIAVVGLFNRRLTLTEIRTWQIRPYHASGGVLFIHLGWNGTGTQFDWSGNGNNGAVTGATVADHVPLGPAFGSAEGIEFPAFAPVAGLSPSQTVMELIAQF